MNRTVLGTAAITIVALAGLTGCGDDDEATGDPDRYCELVGELEQIGGEVFADLSEDASEEDFAEAEARFVAEADEELDELQEAAPAEIADDVEDYVDATRERAEGDVSTDVGDAEERILAWEEANC